MQALSWSGPAMKKSLSWAEPAVMRVVCWTGPAAIKALYWAESAVEGCHHPQAPLYFPLAHM